MPGTLKYLCYRESFAPLSPIVFHHCPPALLAAAEEMLSHRAKLLLVHAVHDVRSVVATIRFMGHHHPTIEPRNDMRNDRANLEPIRTSA
ncbi:MAG TPA: hypothetical protein DEO88_01660 [Syntrophobacteraceae bacterium]|nr:hypothetical protein [Syntrophobacteraceae bacterium]